MVMDDPDSPKSSSKRDLFPPELANDLEQLDPRQQPYNSANPLPAWPNTPTQQQYNWYSASAADLARRTSILFR